MTEIFKYLKGDKAIWMIAILFGLVSIVTVYSFIPVLIAQTGGTPEGHLIKHVFILFTGFVIMFYTHRIDFKYFSRLAQVLFWAAVVLLVLTLLVGKNINGAKRWIELPVLNQSFQTSDFAKLALVMYVARLLVMKKDVLDNFREGIWPILWPILLVTGLILPQDFSTAAMLFGICMLLLFIGKVPVKHLGIIMLSLVGGIFLFVLIGRSVPDACPRCETWANRMEAFVMGEEASVDAKESDQAEKAQQAIANGGFWGTGPGKGEYKRLLFAAAADMYFAAFIEEFGMPGTLTIVFIFLILLYRSIRVALKCEKNFGMYLCLGISMALMCQALVNMAVPTGLVPVTGQNMPMLGLGGTSLWFTCISLGMILSVSRSTTESSENEIKEKSTADKEKYAVA